MSRAMRKFLPLIFLAFVAARAAGQDQPDPAAQARVHIGPLALSPFLSLTNAGVDNNVFNEPSDAPPRSDFTMTVQPKVDLWLHMGRSILIGNVTEDLVYYRTYVDERSANNFDKLGLLAPLTRIIFKADVEYLNTNDRPGFEIDLRPHRTELTYDGAVELRALSKTFVGVRAAHQKVDYDATDVFDSASLQTELNRTVTSEALTVRHQLTTLTSLTFDAGKQHDRFEFNPLRDSDSTVLAGGVLFDPFALLKGSAKVGYRDFEPVVPGLPNFKGTTVAVDLSYVALGSTKVAVGAARDINYSFDVNQPYYVQTGGTVAVTQQIFGPVDIVGRVGFQRLDYRDRVGAVVAVRDRTDHVHSYGVGFGYHLGSEIRVGFNVDQAHRTSALNDRQYDDLRYGTAVTYGF